MSVIAYLTPPHNPLKMPDAAKIPNPCGIKWQGPMLSGKQSVNEAMIEQERRIRTNQHPTSNIPQPTFDRLSPFT